MIETIRLYVLYIVWILSIISCFVIGVFLEEHKWLERYVFVCLSVALCTTCFIGICFIL